MSSNTELFDSFSLDQTRQDQAHLKSSNNLCTTLLDFTSKTFDGELAAKVDSNLNVRLKALAIVKDEIIIFNHLPIIVKSLPY